jgi:hypothetical protein
LSTSRSPALTFRLTPMEVEALHCLPVFASGRTFGRELQEQLRDDGSITLSDVQLGRICRMAAYEEGNGEFERCIRAAFRRSLAGMFRNVV